MNGFFIWTLICTSVFYVGINSNGGDETRGERIPIVHDFDEEIEVEINDDETDHSDPIKVRKSSEDYQIIQTQKVAVINGNVSGFKKDGGSRTITGGYFKFTVQKYKKTKSDDCLKLVTIRKSYGDHVIEKVKISCEYIEPDKKRGPYLRFTGVIYENSLTLGITYVVKDGICLDMPYWDPSAVSKDRGTKLDEAACFALTKRTIAERISGIIPEPKPISPEDIEIMDKQIVAVMDGSIKDFKLKSTKQKFYSENFEVEVKDFQRGDQCVRVVYIMRDDHDENFEEVKLSCRVNGPIVTSDEDIVFNYGNIIYMLDAHRGVFVLKDGVCLQRTYLVRHEEVLKTDEILSSHDCFLVTRWRRDERSSDIKLDKDPPLKSLQTPGLMWLLSLNGDTTGYTAVAGKKFYSGGAVTMETQDFHKNTEECVRLVTLSIRGVEADTFQVSCGPIINANVNDMYAKYGNAFIVKPVRGGNTYQAIFNTRKEYCPTKLYTVQWRLFYSSTIETSNGPPTTDKECQDLMGESLRRSNDIPLYYGTIKVGNHLSIGYDRDAGEELSSFVQPQSPSRGSFRNIFNGWLL